MEQREYLCRHVSAPSAFASLWEKSAAIPFCHLTSGEEVAVKTEARLHWDSQHVFLQVVCFEPLMDQLRATAGESQEIWQEDSIEVFVDVQGSAEAYSQLIVNAAGRVWGLEKHFASDWKTKLKVLIVRAEKQWTLDLTLPFEILGVNSVRRGDVWRINLVRNRPARDPDQEHVVSAWSPTLTRSPHMPKRFGVLFFADEEGKIPKNDRKIVPLILPAYRSPLRPTPMPAVTPKASEIEALLSGPFWEEPSGWLMTFVVQPDKRAMVESDFDGQWTDPPDLESCGLPPAHIYLRNEDTMMCTGAFLGGLARKLQVREDAATRDRANRCVRGLYRVYELGREIERGFTPKPYGGKCSQQFSPDNFDNYYLGLGQYYPLADDKHRKLIGEILCESASYWIRHKHACPFPYFQYGMWDNEKDPDPSGHWPLLWLPLYRLAHTISQDATYERAYHRIKDRFLRLGQSDATTLRAGSYHRWVLQLSALMEWSPEDRALWLKGIEQWRRLIFENEVNVCRGHIRVGEACARHLGDQELALYLAQEIAGLTENKMIYGYQWNDPVMIPKDDPTRRIYWRLLDGDFLAETYFAIWDGRQGGLWK